MVALPVKTLVLVFLLFVRSVFAMVRRFTLGPRRPGWDIPTELAQTVLRTGLLASTWWGFEWLRGLMDRPQHSPVLDRVEFEPVDAGGVPSEWCRPKAGAVNRTIVFIHGGGYVVGSLNVYRELIARLALGAEAQVLALDYRLAPEHLFPAAHDDCLTAYRWLLEQGVTPDRIALSGDSAGGALCVDLMCTARDEGSPLPAAALLFSPWVDPYATGGSMVENEPFDTITPAAVARYIAAYTGVEPAAGERFGARPVDEARVAPLRAKHRDLPPMRIAVGTCEIFLDQDREFAKAASAAGVDATLAEVQDCFHIFQNMTSFIPNAEHALRDGVHFLKERVPKSGEQPVEAVGMRL
jgi:monoterpene epsilon-lactone hydrolase